MPTTCDVVAVIAWHVGTAIEKTREDVLFSHQTKELRKDEFIRVVKNIVSCVLLVEILL